MGNTYPSCPSRVAELNRREKATEMYLEASHSPFGPSHVGLCLCVLGSTLDFALISLTTYVKNSST